MEPNFDAFQLIGQIALGIIGFSAILIGLSRTSEGFSEPDNFRVQLLTYSAFGSMFGSIIPFAIFSDNNFEAAWLICFWVVSIYSVMGLIVFPRRMLNLRRLGHKDIFPIKLYLFQTGVLSIIFILSLLMITTNFYNPSQIYIICLMLYLFQSSVAFIRTMFFRVN
ncbi:hypothetical protein N9731_00825 [Gammaproteobacteria bacterium]|jgi:hypothetical protein|nr:hypothetical protein [Gammaproteobacteria bacterium]MDA9315064.1 hypothetical protein [Gammaproteobacteria bacterium]MDA9342954.1 hypothetical protein [Gammaproteobacteria bacterium]MDB4135211.1 hypothetical protein [Gammaproteobacteria bacterium]MDB4158919.1 hypothetical protein [Gammaproteobacteria bacterium]|tara:strand:+ start:65 stop:562 length:498 start_codon:yes stop_codon:yes gene_type:complete